MKKIPDPKKMKRVKGPKITPKDHLRAKIKITTYIDEDILVALKQRAAETGSKYQTLMNQLLRLALLGGQKDIFERLKRLEKAVFKNNAA